MTSVASARRCTRAGQASTDDYDLPDPPEPTSSCAPGTFRRPRCCNMSRASRR